MLTTGIYRKDQLDDQKNLLTVFGNEKKISLALYPAIASDSDKNSITERILLSSTDKRGTYKRTHSNRFEEFDRHSLRVIQERFKTDSPLIIHDAAVSDGRTSYELFNKLCDLFPKLEYYASDYDAHIWVIESGRKKLVLDSADTALELTLPPFVINLSTKRRRPFSLGNALRFVLKHTLVPRMISGYKCGRIEASKQLISFAEAIALAKKDRRFILLQHNLLDESPLSQPVDIFRAMNILNASYFTNEDFGIVIAHIFSSLSDEGLFLVGSNQDANTVVNGGIFVKTKSRFKQIWQSGDGCPVEDNILRYRN